MLIFCTLAGIGAIIDYRSRRIPNELLVIMLLWSMIYRYVADSWLGCLEFLLQGGLLLGLAFPLYKIGSIGAGDVKLIALCCGFLKGNCLLSFLFSSLLIAAIFSIYKMMKNGMTKERLEYFLAYVSEVGRSGRWSLYIHSQRELGRVGICMSGPVFFSLLLHMGGFY